MRKARKTSTEPEISTWPAELTKAHEQMREEDARRIATGEATPEQIQAENSVFPKNCSIKIVKLAI